MEETTESISKYGVLVPGLARPRAEGGYEIIAGHWRKRGSERAGLNTMPVIVRNYTDDETTIIMVDSNIQREDILPSEKAKAYAMKYEAMKHQGSKGGSTLDEVGEAAGESGKTVQRYVWLARLSDELLDMVDKKKIGIAQGVDISFLTEEAQQWVSVILEETGSAVNASQSAKLKEYGKNGGLTLEMVRLILEQEKPKERKVMIKSDKINKYFPVFSVSSFSQFCSLEIRTFNCLKRLFVTSISRLRSPCSVRMLCFSIAEAATPKWTVGIWSIPCRS